MCDYLFFIIVHLHIMVTGCDALFFVVIHRYILVTGCDTGFGNLLAKRLDKLGCHVFASCLTETGETELKKCSSDRMTVLSLDVSRPDSVRRALSLVKEKLPYGRGL